MRALLALALLAGAAMARAGNTDAGYRFSVAPQPARETDALIVTIETLRQQCVPLPTVIGLEDLGNGVMRIPLPGSDACSQNPPATRSYDVGRLPPGRYVFRFALCGLPPWVPGDGCAPPLAELPVHVRGVSAAPHAIPAHSNFSLAAYACLAAAFACVVLRGR